MKVLHICPDYLGTRLYNNLFSALQTVGVVNKVFANSSNIQNDNGRSMDLKIWEERFNLIDRLIYFRKQQSLFNTICTEFPINEFNLVHAHTLFSSGFSAYLLNKKFGIKYIVSIRNTDVNIFFKYMFHLRHLGRVIMNNAQNIIFLSPSYQDYVVSKYVPNIRKKIILDKSYVIPNGIDEYFLRNRFKGERITSLKSIKLIYVGEVNSNKNIETTIKACKVLIKKGLSVRYTIVGGISDIKYKKIFANCSFIKYIPKCLKEEVLMHLRNSDIFVMPSIYETFGLVYAEAMSQGMPLIYSKGQGFDGHFEDGVVGYSVNCFDYTDISQKIIDLYNNYQQFSRRCIYLVERFNWVTIAEKYREIYSL